MQYIITITISTEHEAHVEAETVDHLDDVVSDYIRILGHDPSTISYDYEINQAFDREET